ncbi:YIP1 family protein [Roseovarius gahaiensis]|uniref:YIP1 family protein n=1 Tax=Roseovarius gahaiensis TaxID=2716691 RepID=A0A967BEN5_9RHOB|nr:YIP1 family protein [Roseovarius gahaiensis]
MNTVNIKQLFVLTLKAPKEAGAQVLALDLPIRGLWLALSLVSVVTSIIFASLMQLAPMGEDQFSDLMRTSPAHSAPLVFALLQWARAVVSVLVIYYVGRMMGGTGQLRDVLAVMAWLQAVTFVLMVGLVIMGAILPMLSSLVILAMVIWWVWAIVSLLNVAHGFDSMFKAGGVLIVSLLGVTVGMSIFFGAISALFVGAS